MQLVAPGHTSAPSAAAQSSRCEPVAFVAQSAPTSAPPRAAARSTRTRAPPTWATAPAMGRPVVQLTQTRRMHGLQMPHVGPGVQGIGLLAQRTSSASNINQADSVD